jgi:hypothetical protein
MRKVRMLNAALWALNVALGVGIILFSVRYLFAGDSKNLSDFKSVDLSESAIPRVEPDRDFAVLKSLRNPLQKEAPRAEARSTLFKAALKGTLASSDPGRGIAFIRSAAKNVDLVASVGEAISHDGKPYEEFRGWVLAEVGLDRAVFANGATKETLRIETLGGGASAPSPANGAVSARVNRAGQSYHPESFKSRLLASAESRQVWGLDPDEIDWVAQNADRVIDQDFQVTPYAGGGLKLESVQPGSIGASRGLAPGDIVKDVNGQPLATITDIRSLFSNPSLRQQAGLRITIERAGKPSVLEYRVLPK